jgi:hypothetical protein
MAGIALVLAIGLVAVWTGGAANAAQPVTQSRYLPEGSSFPTPCPIQFQDVPADYTFYSVVRCLACRNILTGYPCGSSASEPCGDSGNPYFRPGAKITRGQIAKIVANAAGLDDPPGTRIFEDVAEGTPFFDYIQRLTNKGYISGYPCGGAGEPCQPGNRPYFRPNADVTRGQAAKIVANTFFPGCDTPARR